MGYFLAGAGVMMFGMLIGSANTRSTIKEVVKTLTEEDDD